MNKCHFIGIGGIGMSGLARIMKSKNVEVTGSDMAKSYVTEGLEHKGIAISYHHEKENIQPGMTVVYSSDIKAENPELEMAKHYQCQLMHRSDLLKTLLEEKRGIAISGTHGKTSTTSLMAWVLMEAGLDPSYAIGGILPAKQSNAEHGSGEFFVAEADESDGTFIKYFPESAILTNLDLDHMNHFKTEENLRRAFMQFARQVKKNLLWCRDDEKLRMLNLRGVSYGFGEGCELRATNFRQDNWKISIDIHYKGKVYPKVEIAQIGRHQALNALAVFGLALILGVHESKIRQGLSTFCGVQRRCEVKTDSQSILVLDDYAHHPTEIKTTLKAIRESVKERRLIAVFQPHRYSRTKDCMGQYGDIFKDVDQVIITDLYSSGEKPVEGVNSQAIQKEIATECVYLPRENLAQAVFERLRPHDVVVTLGAGDITKVGKDLSQLLKEKSIPKYTVGVVFGGRSSEHEISLLSARNFIDSLKPDLYNLQYFRIDKKGNWFNSDSTLEYGEKLKGHEILSCDIFIPVLHGPYGEDGTIQGFFEILGKPYIGCGHQSSAVCMDKSVTKKILAYHGLPIVPFVDFRACDYNENTLNEIESQLKYPLFVKPVHLGSSVGVKKVADRKDLARAIEEALQLDTHIMVERGLNIREIEFAVHGNKEIATYPPGEICSSGQVYDYQSKYGSQAMTATPKADLTDEKIEEGMNLAKKAYLVADCEGMARVDLFLDENNKFWVNEINTIPGFTQNSLYPAICRENGLRTPELLDKLIVLALSRHRQKALL